MLLALSGGVDSTVLAAVLYKNLGKGLRVMVDHGLLRKDEAKNVIQTLKKRSRVNLVNAQSLF